MNQAVVPQGQPVSAASRPLLALLSLALLGGSALAQTAAPDLSAYRTMAGALEKAVQDRPSSAAASLADLDRATAAYTTLKPSLDSPLLTTGIDRALQSSRAALSHAPADLEAQVVQVRSLMRKALYDQTLGRPHTPGPAAASQAALLASEFGLQGQTRARFLQVASSADSGVAARLLRRAAAQRVQASLAPATVPQNAAQRAVSYLALARATGWFTTVQDAPDTGGLKLPQFAETLASLTTSNDAALAGQLVTLKSGAAAFVTASVKAVQTGSSVPAAQPAVQPPVTTIPATTAPATTAPAQTSPATTPAVAPAVQPAAGLDATYAALARAQTAAGHSDLQTARTELGRAAQALTTSGLGSTGGYDTLLGDLDALQNRKGLRATEVQAVMAELGNLEHRASAAPTSALDATSALVARVGTPVIPLLFLLLGLLSLYPLYLLNLAFGGRNNYWRAIAASLGLLFLPVLLEGLGGTFAFLGDLSGVGLLRALGSLSLHQGAWGLPLWLLVGIGAVALSSYGFRGLCQQFGLLGGSSSSNDFARAETPQPALDWDEEL